jgi:hypothetical protein
MQTNQLFLPTAVKKFVPQTHQQADRVVDFCNSAHNKGIELKHLITWKETER